MPATSAEISRFRRKLRGDIESMPEDYINAVLDEAIELYSTYNRQIQFAAALVLGCRDLRMAAAGDVDYTQNASAEKRSQVYANLEKLEQSYQADLDRLIIEAKELSEGAPVRWGGLEVGGRDEEWPNA